MNLKPLGNRVILEVINEEERVVGGIVLPETAKDKPNIGIVRAVGPGKYVSGKLVPIDLKVGDKVVYKKFSGTEVELDEEGTFIIVRLSDVVAVYE